MGYSVATTLNDKVGTMRPRCLSSMIESRSRYDLDKAQLAAEASIILEALQRFHNSHILLPYPPFINEFFT